jgi:short-subunit dehydrogenase
MPTPAFPAGGLAVVTGASSGIGAAIALELSRGGRPVLAVARRADRLAALAAEAAAAGAAPIHPFPLDVTLPDAPARLLARARELGGASWLVNDAGIFLTGRVAELGASAQAALVRLNCEALLALTATFLPDLLARGAGTVLNIGSGSAFQPTPFYAVYGASKAFVLSFSEALSEELRGTGVTVTAFTPGTVRTEIFTGPRRTRWYDITAEKAAHAAIRAAESRKVVAHVGPVIRFFAFLGRLLPRAVIRRVGNRAALRVLGIDRPPAAPPA